MPELSPLKKELYKPSEKTGVYEGLIDAVSKGRLSDVRSTLEAAGETLLPEELFDTGKEDCAPVVMHFSILRKLPELIQTVHEHGHGFPTEMLTKTKFNGETVDDMDGLGLPVLFEEEYTFMEYLIEHDALAQIFTPEVWKNHVNAMDELWAAIPEKEREKLKDKVDYAAVRRESLQMGDDITLVIDESLKKVDLFRPNRLGKTAVEIDTTWFRAADIARQLEENGDPLKAEDLERRLPNGNRLIREAAEQGGFANFTLLAKKTGKTITLEELTERRGEEGKSTLDLIVQKRQMRQLLDPELWINRGREAKQVWDRIPQGDKAAFDFDEILSSINERSIKNLVSGNAGRGV